MSSDTKSIDEVTPLVFTQTETCLAAVKGQIVNAPLWHTKLLCSGSEKKAATLQTLQWMFKTEPTMK